MGVIVLQGYGATETAAGACTTMADHPLGCVGLAAAAGRDADRRRRRDPVPRPDAVQGLLAQPRGDGRGVHRRRLVQERRPRAARRRGPAPSCTAGRRTSSSCPTGSTCTRRTSRTRSGSPASATRLPSRRARADRGDRARAGRRPGRQRRHAGARADGRGAGDDRCRRQGREPGARPEPADHRLAPVARGRTSRARTRSRSSATRSVPGRPTRRRCR